ncbi:MAG TPA: hypothetical protein VGZ23_02325 [bacterium]|nr:hypothetical protein [bacterium]
MDKMMQQTIRQRLSVLRAEERTAHAHIRRIQKEREILEKTLVDLQAMEKSPHDHSRVVPHRQPGHNALVIAEILKGAGRPMSVRAIAQHAHESGQIASDREAKGVYNIVSTVLKRNSKNGHSTFVKVDRGLFYLRVPPKHSSTASAIPSAAAS